MQPGAPQAAPPPANNQMPQRQEERKIEERKTEGAVAAVEKEAGGKPDNKTDNKDVGKPENREKVREAMVAKAKEIATDMSRATTIEAQTVNQAVVLGLISYVPGFSAYQNSNVPDTLGQAVARQYSRPNVDNRDAQRRMSQTSDTSYRQMVESQYK
jgi:hypothetical protein